MAGKVVDTEALEKASLALGTYIEQIQNSISRMTDAAQDCADNMGSDVHSQKAIAQIQSCAKEMSRGVQAAEDLRKRICETKRRIEESAQGW